MDAIVSGAPTAAIAPNVIATAPIATTSGTSRRRRRKASASTPAITTSATTSSRATEPASVSARSSASTGTPVTV
jgi:hypothetical protein